VVNKFLADITPYGHQDFEPKLIGRGINVMISPLPRNKRAKHPRQTEGQAAAPAPHPVHADNNNHRETVQRSNKAQPEQKPDGNFGNNPFAQLELNRGA
jgi:hypothetical protein